MVITVEKVKGWKRIDATLDNNPTAIPVTLKTVTRAPPQPQPIKSVAIGRVRKGKPLKIFGCQGDLSAPCGVLFSNPLELKEACQWRRHPRIHQSGMCHGLLSSLLVQLGGQFDIYSTPN